MCIVECYDLCEGADRRVQQILQISIQAQLELCIHQKAHLVPEIAPIPCGVKILYHDGTVMPAMTRCRNHVKLKYFTRRRRDACK